MKQANIKIKNFKNNRAIIGALAEAFDKSFITIERWFESKDDRLTSDKARKVFEEYESKTGQPV